jgi:hypothetical protein
LSAPPDERLGRLAAHVKKYHYPRLSEEQIAEILSRGNNRYLSLAAPTEGEQEYLLGWMIDILMSWEARDFDVAKNRQDAPRLAGYGEVMRANCIKNAFRSFRAASRPDRAKTRRAKAHSRSG